MTVENVRGGAKKTLRNDLLLILGILLAALLAYTLYMLLRDPGEIVTVTVNGEAYAEYSLSEARTVTLPSYDGAGENLLVIENGAAHVASADCPDGICVAHAPISLVGDAIVCLPHRVVITVEEGR